MVNELNPRFQQACDARKSNKRCTWYKNILTRCGTQYLHTSDFNIILKQEEHTESVETVSLTNIRKRQPDDSVTQYELQPLRVVVASGQWLAAGPDREVSMLQGATKHPRVKDLLQANNGSSPPMLTALHEGLCDALGRIETSGLNLESWQVVKDYDNWT